MKSIFKVLTGTIIFTVFFCLMSSAVFAQEAFDITSYDVNVAITEKNVYRINETIEVYFNQPRHGIYRNITYKGKMYRDITDSRYQETRYRASVKNIKVNANYSVSRSGDNVIVQIGDANSYVEGKVTYNISYDMSYGNDNIADFDEVYYNIIGNNWDTTIDKVNFTVELPKNFDASKLGIVTGQYGEQNTNKVSFDVIGNKITGSTLEKLNNYEGITMRVELPEGYFVIPNPVILDWAVLAIIVLVTLICILLFYKFGRNERLVQTVEFNPPEVLTPAEIGFIYDGCVDNKDIISLIMYWADKGYLTIQEGDRKNLTLTKIKDIDNSSKYFEKYMFNALFKNREQVTTDELKNTFYTTINVTRTSIYNHFSEDKNRIFTSISIALKYLFNFITILPIIAVLLIKFYRELYTLTESLIFSGIIGILVLIPVFLLINTLGKWRINKPAWRMFKLIFSIILLTISMGSFLFLTLDSYLPLLPMVAAIATVIIGLCAVFITKRTPRGAELFGKTLGLRDFIERAERDKLVRLVEQNPNYFYNILPYAYVLGITDVWAKNFESIAIEPPEWYQGDYHRGFTPMILAMSLNHSMSHIQTNMTSTPAPSGGGGGIGGGFSGGGFSGGGGGGGGGGSW